MGQHGVDIAANVFTGGLGFPTGEGGIDSVKKHFKKKKAAGSNLDETLAAQALEFLDVSRGLRNEFFDQLAYGLSTGRLPDELLPVAQGGIERELSKGSQEAQLVKDAYGQMGQGRTTGAVKTRARTLLQANQAVQSVPSDILNAILLASPNAVIGQAGQTGLQGLGQLSDLSAMMSSARAERSGATLGAIGAGAGGLIGAGVRGASLYSSTPAASSTLPQAVWT